MHFPEWNNIWITINISLTFVPKGPINNSPALIQIMAWHLSGVKPLSEPMMISLLTHICVTRPQCILISSRFSDRLIFNMGRNLWNYGPYIETGLTGVKQCTFHWFISNGIAQKEMVLNSFISHLIMITCISYDIIFTISLQKMINIVQL